MTQRRNQPASGTVAEWFPTRNDLPADVREPMVEILNRNLADTTDLLTQAKFAHWNVKGQTFYQLHLLFDELAETLLEHQDLLAERATALGGQAMGTVRMAARDSSIPEIRADAITGEEYVRTVADNLAVHAANLRRAADTADDYGDEDTMDLFIEISRDVDKYLWFLDAHLQASSAGPSESTTNRGESQMGIRSGTTRSPRSVQQSGRGPIRTSGGRRYGHRSFERTGRPGRPAGHR